MPFKIRLLILSLALLLYSSNHESFMDYDQNTIAFDVHKDKIQISGALYPNLYQDLQASDSNKNNPLYDIIRDFFSPSQKTTPYSIVPNLERISASTETFQEKCLKKYMMP